MKEIVYAVLAAAILTACSDEPVITETPQAAEPMSGYVFPNSPSFKSTQSRSGSTFETDWENFQTITVSGLGTIDLPWAPNSSGTGNPNKKDVKKEDGWIMVVHTLNLKIQINKALLYPGLIMPIMQPEPLHAGICGINSASPMRAVSATTVSITNMSMPLPAMRRIIFAEAVSSMTHDVCI